jgi:Tfp pilus assembly protein PilV
MGRNITPKSIAGASLVEIMVSLILVALALLAIVTVFPNMAKHRKGLHEADQAKMLAAEALDFLQYYPCTGLSDGYTKLKERYEDNGGYPINMGSATYSVSNPTCTQGTGSISINTVTVEVTWPKGGKTHRVKMTGALK